MIRVNSMRRGNFTPWIGAAVLVCLIALRPATACAQNMGSERAPAAEIDASSDSAEVPAEVSAMANGGGGYGGGANFSGSGRGSAMAAHSGIPSSLRAPPVRGRSARGLDALTRGTGGATRAGGSMLGGGRSSAHRHSVLKSLRSLHSAHGPSSVDVDWARARMKSALVGATPNTIPGIAAEKVSYSGDFEDSTKGTALISPPDPGTTGPFAFEPSLNAKLPGFSERPHLLPSLHVRGSFRGKGNGRRSARNRTQTNSAGQQSSPFAASPDDGLGLDDLKDVMGTGIASDPASDLGISLSPSVQQQ